MNKVGKYRISVGEPWNYDGPNGPNLIHGRIIRELAPDCLIFKSDQELHFGGAKGKNILLKSRYEGETLKCKEEYCGVINGRLILSENVNESLDALEKQSKLVLIGSLKKL